MEPVRLAVRKMVELAMRCGDIDNRYVDTSDSMLEGAKAHRKIQESYQSGYQKEVSLSIEVQIDGIDVIIQGRADGLITEDNGKVVLDEIKTTTMPLEHIHRHAEQHLAQAKCYAFMLLKKMKTEGSDLNFKETEAMTIQLTYYQLETEEIEKQRREFTYGELEEFFRELLDKYGVWMRYERDWKQIRDSSIKEIGFPFPDYRKGQRELAVVVYRTIEKNKKLYAQAPTGIGKTLSALFPSVKAMGEGKCKKLFYLTAKTVTRGVAEDAISLMCSRGLRFKSVTLRAKDKICFMEQSNCNPEYCQYAKGHYDRINDALLDILENNDVITPDITEKYARKHRVCPHEMGLDATIWADLVIGDYNHVFDPTVYLKRFFSDVQEEYVFLVDEAHNLVDRVRDMYTGQLRKSEFYILKKKLKDRNKIAQKLKRTLDRINKYFIDVRKEMGASDTKCRTDAEQDTVFNTLLMSFLTAAGDWLAQERYNTHALHEEVLELYFCALKFARIAEFYDEHFCRISEIFGSDASLTYFCLDPSGVTAMCLERAKATVMFSATLTPLPYYREVLGGREEDDMVALPSPFDSNRMMLLAHRGISTKYIDREESIVPITEVIYASVSKRKGNYLVFFPSYEYMGKVYDMFRREYPGINTLLQKGDMTEEERVGFLAGFDEKNSETLVGFCVLGGVFSEGIDLKGNRLIGTVIVGVGLPKITMRRNLIRDYFERKNGRGFDYAYVFPGMNKVLQAAGRVIRTESDYGLVLLIDSRFGTAKYGSLYPRHWSHIKMIGNTGLLEGMLDEFYLLL